MEGIINYLWEGSICLFILYGFYRIFLSEYTFFDWNRAYLLLIISLVLIIPLLSIPSISSGEGSVFSTGYSYFLPEVQLDNESPGEASILPSFFNFLTGIYFLGLIIASIRFITGLFQIYRNIYNSKKIHHLGYILAIRPDFQASSFFNYIFLPDYNPSDSEQQLIISHEINHATRYHSLDILFIQLLKIIFWFHPFTKMLESSLTEVHEFQVDNEITKSCSKTDYANLLLKLILADRQKQLMNNYFNKFQTKKRIIMMGKTESNLREKCRFLMAIPLLALLVIVFSCEGNEDHELIIDADESGETVLRSSSGEVFDVVENPPAPAGGFEGWNKYLTENLTYPAQAKREGIEGTVYVLFVVEVDGSIQGVEILRGIGGGCDEEALRVIRNAPDWEPGTQKGQKVNVKMRVPIKFKLPETT
ncbi:MAG TPA: M56 family metallopeptidase [Anditalea sp.]|nr:M56 family metallopeptidase [Anditalea sp.]